MRKRERYAQPAGAAGAAGVGTDPQRPFGIPIYEYMRSISEKRKREEDQRSDAQAGPQQEEAQNTPPAKRSKRKHTSAAAAAAAAEAGGAQLLCEKYRPTDFFDLCGNDDANRRVLRWMNYWKSVVFGTEPILNDYTDRLGRPQRKILLLNGPPGTGKTTAAHVIARQAGFDVLEINASDERGAAVVQNRIVSAIQSHQVHRRRPICIVADEVEGASEHGFVRALVNIVNEDAAALAHRGGTITGKNSSKKKKKKQHALLQRPIIAVCNNAWASSLHALRPLAEIVNFQRQPQTRLVKQLEKVCVDEKIRLDSRELVAIVEQNNFDLRACMIALQYLCAQRKLLGGSTKTKSILDSSSTLDSSVEATSWNAILRQQFGSSRAVPFKAIECCSDIDRLVLGCFTAYPETGFNDDLVRKPAQLGDYLALCDSRAAAASTELKSLAVHACGQLFRSPALAAMTGSLPSRAQGWAFGRPVNTFETQRQTHGIVQSVLKRAANSVRTQVSETIATLDVLPLAVHISTAPKLGTVVSLEDKQRLELIAELLIELGINLRTEKLENGTFAHLLDPPVHEACVISEKERGESAYGSYIARSKIKDALNEIRARESRVCAQSQTQLNAKHREATEKETKHPTRPAAVDFSSFFTTPQTSATQLERTAEAKATRVWVQYSEGFSNAVRKNVTWDDLFNVS